MTTWVLTPTTIDPVSHLQEQMLGWNFSGATFEDVFQGCTILYWYGWRWSITEDDTRPVTYPQPCFWKMQLQKPGYNPVIVTDTDYFVLRAGVVSRLAIGDLASYTKTQWGGPQALGGTSVSVSVNVPVIPTIISSMPNPDVSY